MYINVSIEKVSIAARRVISPDITRIDYTIPVRSVSALEPQSNISTDFFVIEWMTMSLGVTDCLNEVTSSDFLPCLFSLAKGCLVRHSISSSGRSGLSVDSVPFEIPFVVVLTKYQKYQAGVK